MGAGVGQVILREKDLPSAELLNLARDFSRVARKTQSRLIVNSDFKVACQIRADGLHLPFKAIIQKNFLAKAKKLGLRVGISAHTLEEASLAEGAGADLVLVGPIFPTASKPGHPGVGLNFIIQVQKVLSIPLWSVGGINPTNLREVLKAGASVAAMRGALLTAPDPAKVVKECLQAANGT
jgi:thiamine-phosphate pyrophosphorylase